jgi:hypothetical protein
MKSKLFSSSARRGFRFLGVVSVFAALALFTTMCTPAAGAHGCSN